MNASFIDLLFPHGIHKTRSFQTIVQIEKKSKLFLHKYFNYLCIMQ